MSFLHLILLIKTIKHVNEWEVYAESQPLRFYDREIIPLLADLIRLLAKQVLMCDPCELVLVENCTFAFNSIVESISIKPNEKILTFSTTYGAYKKILRHKCEQSKAQLVEQKVEFPILDQDDLNRKFITKLNDILVGDEEEKLVKFIFVDHVPSNQPFLIPIKQMADLCKSKRPDILFIVDAAHSLGSVKHFNLKELANVDLLFANCHKWFCGPKGTALFYKNKLSNVNILPAVKSHGINGGFSSEFIWSGLRQYSSYLGLYSTLSVWQECLGGLEPAIDYCQTLARTASKYLKEVWSTNYLVDPSLCTTMVCIKLPISFINNVIKAKQLMSDSKLMDLNLDYDYAELVQNYFYFSHNIEVPIKSVQNELYVRISCHVYNNLDEYKCLADAVLKDILI